MRFRIGHIGVMVPATGLAVAGLAFLAGCGGDTETTTVAGNTETVTTTVTAPAPKGERGAGRSAREARREGRREALGEEGDRPFFGAGGAKARKGRPILKCLQEQRAAGSEGAPTSLKEIKARQKKVRACVQEKLGDEAPRFFGGEGGGERPGAAGGQRFGGSPQGNGFGGGQRDGN